MPTEIFPNTVFPQQRLQALGVSAGTIASLLAAWNSYSLAQQAALGTSWEGLSNADFLTAIGGGLSPVVLSPTQPWGAPQVWASGIYYDITPTRSIVTYNGVTYAALQASVGDVPGTDASTWLPLTGSNIGKPCPDLQIGVSASVAYDTDGSGWKAIPNSIIAPGTTAPIEIDFLLPYYQLSASSGQTTSTNTGCRIRLVDDTGAAVPGGITALLTPTALTGTATAGGPVMATGVVTPNSTARTYSLQHQPVNAHIIGLMFANDAFTSMYPIMKARYA